MNHCHLHLTQRMTLHMVLLLNTVVVTILVNLCNVLPASREYTHVEVNVVITSDRDRTQCISIPLLNNRLPGSPVQFLLKATSSRYVYSTTAVPSRVTILDDGKYKYRVDYFIIILYCMYYESRGS